MTPVARLAALVGSDPVAVATRNRDTLRKKLADADTKVAATAADIDATRASLRSSAGEDGADPGLLASRLAKLRQDLAAGEELVAVLRDALSEAETGLADVKAGAEREALGAELRPLDAGTASGLRDFEKHLGPLSDALSRAFANDAAAARIRERLGLPPASTLNGDLSAVLQRLYQSLVAAHGDRHGRGVGSHPMEVPIFNAEVDAPKAKALGIV